MKSLFVCLAVMTATISYAALPAEAKFAVEWTTRFSGNQNDWDSVWVTKLSNTIRKESEIEIAYRPSSKEPVSERYIFKPGDLTIAPFDHGKKRRVLYIHSFKGESGASVTIRIDNVEVILVLKPTAGSYDVRNFHATIYD